MDKPAIAEILSEIAVFMDIKGENPFKIRAYQNGARVLETMPDDLDTLIAGDLLKHVPGIGEALAEKITTLRKTGKLPFYDELRASIPAGLPSMLEIPGLGPKKVKMLWHELGIESIEMLQAACEDGRVAALKGFGAKTRDNILSGIRNREAYSKRHLWPEAADVARPILAGLKKLPGVIHAAAAGSLRRRLETVGDLDFLAAAEDPLPVMDWFTTLAGVAEVTAKGETKSSVLFEGGLQADLRVVPEAQFFFALHHFTGSKDHNVAMRHRALQRGLSLSEWGFSTKNPETPAPSAKSEADIFAALGLPYIAPELREGLGEIEAAESGKLPALVSEDQIRGAFHNHTTESDGQNTLEEMIAGAEALGWEYFGVADHSKSSVQANGLSEDRLLRQVERIRKINTSGRFKTYVFAGSEVDILKDGRLDFDDSVLVRLDYVVASVHAAFTLDSEAMTARLVRALENPYVTMLGHMTGRILLRREPYALDVERVIDAAVANKKIIELNAAPKRLDMDWRLWSRAAEKGLLCSINPDAHSVAGLQWVRNGVAAARKGRLEARNILNCRSLPEVRKYFGK